METNRGISRKQSETILESYSKISWKMKGKFIARQCRNFLESTWGEFLRSKGGNIQMGSRKSNEGQHLGHMTCLV